MKCSSFVWTTVLFFLLCLAVASPVWGNDGGQVSSLTHLNGRSRQIVNISTFCLPSDNTGRTFFYDRQSESFKVPTGFSFIITDVVITPCGNAPNNTDPFLVVVTIGGGRVFTAGYVGAITKHYQLTSGLVVPEEASLEGRNASSSDQVEVQLLGYFVKRSGLGIGEPFSEE